MKAIGAVSPGWWQTTQLLKMIGATSFENVTATLDFSLALPTPCARKKPASTTIRARQNALVRLMEIS
jgi:hypothetical protein